ncbi:hypothetical protein GQ457_14G015420 [Hibiscus cannabinus]
MTGENIDEIEMLSSSAESSKEPKTSKVVETPTVNTKNKRKGKKIVEAVEAKGGKKKKTSSAWDHFKAIDGDKEHAECIYYFESKTKCNADGTIETVSVPKLWRFDQEKIREALAKMVILDELPFSFVEREGFRMFCKIAIPDFIPPSHTSITRDCYALFIEKRRTLKNFFKNFSSRVCLTTDTWTSAQNLSYMCLTAHFIDDTWKLHKMIINFCPIVGHSGELIGRAVEKCLLEWGLKRILTVTVDNASSNDLAVKYLKQIVNLWDGSVLDAQFLHMRCAAHILNLVVKDGLKDVDNSVMKVRAAVKYVRSSPARLQKFRSCIEEENINNKSLVCLDIETRWNSTYCMLKSALVFIKAFKNMKTKCIPYTKELRKVGGPPDDEDWDKVTAFLPFLEIFYEATLSFSGSRYVTGNNFVEEIFDIGYTINRYLDDSNVGLKSMARQMKMKFDKYWENVNNVNVLMFIALVLDPRHKLRYVEWIVRRSYDPSNSFALCHRIKETLTSLFEFYASSQPPASQMKSSSIESSGHGDGGIRKLKGTNLRKDFVNESMQTMNYPILMRMARDVLAIPISTVASESAFSTGGHVLDSFRTSLTPRLVEALICTQDWIRASHNTIVVEENLLALENMEEGCEEAVLGLHHMRQKDQLHFKECMIQGLCENSLVGYLAIDGSMVGAGDAWCASRGGTVPPLASLNAASLAEGFNFFQPVTVVDAAAGRLPWRPSLFFSWCASMFLSMICSLCCRATGIFVGFFSSFVRLGIVPFQWLVSCSVVATIRAEWSKEQSSWPGHTVGSVLGLLDVAKGAPLPAPFALVAFGVSAPGVRAVSLARTCGCSYCG